LVRTSRSGDDFHSQLQYDRPGNRIDPKEAALVHKEDSFAEEKNESENLERAVA
jgi:hypothetical protein